MPNYCRIHSPWFGMVKRWLAVYVSNSKHDLKFKHVNVPNHCRIHSPWFGTFTCLNLRWCLELLT